MDRSPPIRSKRGHLKVATHPAFRCRRRSSQSSAPKGATPRLLAPFPGSVSCPFGTVSRSPTRAPERGGDFSLCRLRRLFACWSPTPTRKKSYGHPRNLKPCGLLCSPMAKVEQEEIFWKDALELVHEDDLPLLWFLVSLVMEEPGASESVEVRFRDAWGNWVVMDVCVLNVLEAPTGNDTGLLVVNVRQTRESTFWRAEMPHGSRQA